MKSIIGNVYQGIRNKPGSVRSDSGRNVLHYGMVAMSAMGVACITYSIVDGRFLVISHAKRNPLNRLGQATFA